MTGPPRSRPGTDRPSTSALDDALRLLARRDHSSAELTQKLRGRGHEAADIDEAIERLRTAGHLDEAGLARRRSASRAEAGYGPARIRADLARRGIPRALQEAALRELEVDWVGRAVAELERRFGPARSSDPGERARRARFLAARGFDAATIGRALGWAGELGPD